MATTDYQGIALVIGACAGFVTVIGGFVMQVAIFRRQGESLEAGKARDAKLDQVHELVNGVSHELQVAQQKVAFGEGEKVGAATEQARNEPTTAPRVSP